MSVPAWLQPLVAAVVNVEPEQLSRFTPPGDGERSSAVLVLFGEGPSGPDVLLLRRADTLRSHAGQVAFPGGGMDPGETAEQTALREAVEETGLEPGGVQVLAELPALFIPFSGYAVVPVVGWWQTPSPVAPGDPAEVAQVMRVPLAQLADRANQVAVTHPSGWTGPGYDVGGVLVWGFTAGLLTRLLELGGLLDPPELSTLRTRPFPEPPASPAAQAGAARPGAPPVPVVPVVTGGE